MLNNDKVIIGLILIALIVAIIYQNYNIKNIFEETVSDEILDTGDSPSDSPSDAPLCSLGDSSCITGDFSSCVPGEFTSC